MFRRCLLLGIVVCLTLFAPSLIRTTHSQLPTAQDETECSKCKQNLRRCLRHQGWWDARGRNACHNIYDCDNRCAPRPSVKVNFTTTGSFNGRGNTITFGSAPDQVTVTFEGRKDVQLDATLLTNTNFGVLTTAVTGNGAVIPPETTFELKITQSTPAAANSGVIKGILEGVVRKDTSTAMLALDKEGPTLGDELTKKIWYTSFNLSYALVPPSTDGGKTTLQGTISCIHC